MKTKILSLLTIIMLITALISCKSDDKSMPNDYQKSNSEELYTKQDAVEQDEKQQNHNQDVTTTKQNETTEPNALTDAEIQKIGKKIIKNATISIEVGNFEKYVTNIKNKLGKFECFISNETQNSYSNSVSGTITIKVKADQFDSLLNVLLKGNDKVISKNVYINDQTADYIDLFQRLKNKKLVLTQYQEILKKAYTINDILEVQQYILQISEDIDATQGRMKYIDYQSSYSTINLTISYNGPKVNQSDFWDMFQKGLIMGWTGIKYFIIAIFTIWPVWILVGIIIFVAKRTQNKKNKTQKN